MSVCSITPDSHEDDPAVNVEMEEENDVVSPKSVSCEDLFQEDQYGGGRHWKKNHKKSITRVLKAVLFETSLVSTKAKKIKKRKLIQKLRKSNAKLEAKLENGLKLKKRDRTFSDGEDIVKKFDAKHVTTKKSKVHPLKSSNPPSLCSDPQTLSAGELDYNEDDSEPKSDNAKEQGFTLRHGRGMMHSYSSGICLILLSLLFLVMGDKVCAIACILTWLFLVPRLGSGNKSFRLMDDSTKIDD